MAVPDDLVGGRDHGDRASPAGTVPVDARSAERRHLLCHPEPSTGCQADGGGDRVDYAAEIDPSWLDGVVTVGVTSGASVPEVLVREVLTFLAERGYGEVESVVAAQESLLFSLPNEIRRDLKAAGLSEKMRHDGGVAEDLSLH